MKGGSFPPKADPREFPRGSRKAHMYKSRRTPPSRPFGSREALLKASSVASVPTIPPYECRTSTTSLPWSSTNFLISERMQSASSYIVTVGALPNDGWQGHEVRKPLASNRSITGLKWTGLCHDPCTNMIVGFVLELVTVMFGVGWRCQRAIVLSKDLFTRIARRVIGLSEVCIV